MRYKGLIVKEFIPDVIAPSVCTPLLTSIAVFMYIITSPACFWMVTYKIYIWTLLPAIWLKSCLLQHVMKVQNTMHFWLVCKIRSSTLSWKGAHTFAFYKYSHCWILTDLIGNYIPVHGKGVVVYIICIFLNGRRYKLLWFPVFTVICRPTDQPGTYIHCNHIC